MNTRQSPIGHKSALILILVATSTALAATTEPLTHSLFWLMIYVSLALGFSFLCSISESVLLSVTPTYIEGLKVNRPVQAKLIKRLKQDNIDQSLAAILTLNTIAHTVGAIGAGAEASMVFGSAWFGLFSAIMTLMILFLSEIIPKTIGALYWSNLVVPTAYFVRILIVLLYPVVWVSEKLTGFISGGKAVHIFSREEFIAMTRVGERTGHIEDNESRIIRNILKLESLKTTDIMTPRTVIFALSEDMRIQDAFATIKSSPFSRIPVFQADIDDITGFVLKTDILLLNAQSQGDRCLKSIKREILAVPTVSPVLTLLDYFFEKRQQIALVVDEYGSTTGLVTLEDLIETLIGFEIVDETDNVEDMQVLARKQWAVRAKTLGIQDVILNEDKSDNEG